MVKTGRHQHTSLRTCVSTLLWRMLSFSMILMAKTRRESRWMARLTLRRRNTSVRPHSKQKQSQRAKDQPRYVADHNKGESFSSNNKKTAARAVHHTPCVTVCPWRRRQHHRLSPPHQADAGRGCKLSGACPLKLRVAPPLPTKTWGGQAPVPPLDAQTHSPRGRRRSSARATAHLRMAL